MSGGGIQTFWPDWKSEGGGGALRGIKEIICVALLKTCQCRISAVYDFHYTTFCYYLHGIINFV